VDRPWWRRLLAPTPLDIDERLAWHYARETQLAHGLAQEAASLVRYPHAQVRILDATGRAHGRAQRVRRALKDLGEAVTDPATESGPLSATAWQRLRAGVSELSGMSEAYLADAHAVERDHPGIARLLYDLHRETAEDRRELIWTLAQLAGTAVTTTPLEAVAA
jgi:hypothetical protein